MVIDELAFDAPKTKDMAGILKALKLDGISTLVATAGLDVNVYPVRRNIDSVTVSPVGELNALTVLAAAEDVGDQGGARCDQRQSQSENDQR